MGPFRRQSKATLTLDAHALVVEKKIRAKLLALGEAIEPSGGSRLDPGAIPDKKERNRTTLPGRAPAVRYEIPHVTGVDSDGTSSKGEPMVVVRLVCGHEYRTQRDRAPKIDDRRSCYRCRREVGP